MTAFLTKARLVAHLSSMPRNARGRGELERILVGMTCEELATGKSKVRVKAPTRWVEPLDGVTAPDEQKQRMRETGF